MEKLKFFEQMTALTVKTLKDSGKAQDAQDLSAALAADQTGQAGAKLLQDAVNKDPALQASLTKQLAALAENKLAELKEQNRALEEQQRIEIQRLAEEAEAARKAREDDRAEFRMYMDSIEQARLANQRAVASGATPAWFNPLLSLIIVLFMCYVVMQLMNPNSLIHDKNRDILNVVLGAIGTAFATIIGYHFGSSNSSRTKDETFRLALERGTSIRPAAGGGSGGGSGDASSGSSPGGPPPPGPRSGDAQAADRALRSADPFATIAPIAMRGLMAELSLSKEQAAGLIGNIGHECGGFRHMQELKPLAGKGGYGWAQWTGPRRRAFEAFALSVNASVDSYDANFGFLVKELRGDERRALAALRSCTTLEEATRSFMQTFERPHPDYLHLDSRLAYARRALQLFAAA